MATAPDLTLPAWFIPVIRFTVGTGFEVTSKHESRHLLQAERVRQAPGFPAS
jgi:hypothetical protein